MRSGDALLDHLFRRAGFGASAADLQAVAGMSYRPPSTTSSNFEQQPDDVDSKIGLPDYVGITTRGQFSPSTEHRRCAAAMAVPHGAHAAPAAGEDGALLAQPLRHRLQQGRGRRRRHRRHQDDGATSRASSPARRDSSSSFARWARQVPRPADRRGAGPRDARLARRPHEHRATRRRRTSAARSWSSSRGGSATTSRPTSTPPRASSPGGISGTCPARWAEMIRRRIRSSSTTRVSTTRRRRPSPSRSMAVPIRIPARPAAAGMQDGIDLLTSLANHPADGAPPGAQALELLLSASSMPPDPAFVDGVASVYLAERHQHARGDAIHPSIAMVHQPRQLQRALRVAGGIRRADDQGDGLDRVLGRYGAHAADQHGADAVRAAQRRRVAAWTSVVRHRRDARAHEFRGAVASNQKFNLARSFSAADSAQPSRVLDAMLQRFTPAPLDPARRTNCSRT